MRGWTLYLLAAPFHFSKGFQQFQCPIRSTRTAIQSAEIDPDETNPVPVDERIDDILRELNSGKPKVSAPPTLQEPPKDGWLDPEARMSPIDSPEEEEEMPPVQRQVERQPAKVINLGWNWWDSGPGPLDRDNDPPSVWQRWKDAGDVEPLNPNIKPYISRYPWDNKK